MIIRTEEVIKGLDELEAHCESMVDKEDPESIWKDHPEDWNAYKINDDSILMGYDWYKEKKQTDEPKNYNWTSAEVQRMKHLRQKGYYIREIAEEMGRSESSIKYKLYSRR